MFAAVLSVMLLSAGDGATLADAGRGPQESVVVESSDTPRYDVPRSWNAPQYGRRAGDGWPRRGYPSYHGIYYRRPYNYRDLYGYPWRQHLEGYATPPYVSPTAEIVPSTPAEVVPATPADAVPPTDPSTSRRPARGGAVR